MRLAKACPDFAPLVAGICVAPDPLERPLAEELRQLTHPKQWLMALHLTCTYLAAKNVDKVPCLPALSAPPAQSQGTSGSIAPTRAGALLVAADAWASLPGRWCRIDLQSVHPAQIVLLTIYKLATPSMLPDVLQYADCCPHHKRCTLRHVGTRAIPALAMDVSLPSTL